MKIFHGTGLEALQSPACHLYIGHHEVEMEQLMTDFKDKVAPYSVTLYDLK